MTYAAAPPLKLQFPSPPLHQKMSSFTLETQCRHGIFFLSWNDPLEDEDIALGLIILIIQRNLDSEEWKCLESIDDNIMMKVFSFGLCLLISMTQLNRRRH